jgi:hypothetical protein
VLVILFYLFIFGLFIHMCIHCSFIPVGYFKNRILPFA